MLRTSFAARWTRRLAMPLAVGALLVGVTACKSSSSGTSSSSSSSSVAAAGSSPSTTAAASGTCQKIRFTLHAGLGVGAVHRYLYSPYKSGSFSSGASGRKTAIVKAALAGVFAVHEFKVAASDIAGCPSVAGIESALTAATSKITGTASQLKSGTVNPTDLASSDNLASSVVTASQGDGITVTPQTPSAVQLATGGA